MLGQRASGAFRPLAEVSLGARVLVATKAATIYLVKTVLPTGLLPFYSYPAHVSLFSWEFGVPVVVVTAAVWDAWRQGRGTRGLRRCWRGTWSCSCRSSASFRSARSNGRPLHLPASVSLVALLGAGFGALWDGPARVRQWKKAALVTAGLLLLGLLSWQSVRQIDVWRNGETLWSSVLQYEPWNTEARNNRASYYYDRGEYGKALEDYNAALAVQPSLGRAHASKRRSAYFNDRAITYVRLGKYAEALADEDQAIGLRPTEASYYFNRGNINF